MSHPSSLGLLICLSGLLSSLPRADAEEKVIHIGMPTTIFRDIPTSFHNVAKRPFQSVMQSLVDAKGEIDLMADPLDVASRLAEGKLDLGVFQGHEFAWAQSKYPDLLPLVIAAQLRDVPMQAMIVVRSNHAAAALADLDGLKVSFPETTRDHCRVFLNREYSKCSARFSEVLTPNTVHDGLEDVIRGRADVTVVDRAAWESYRMLYSSRIDKVRILARSEVFPVGVIAYRKGTLSPELLAKFRNGLTRINADVQGKFLMSQMKIRGFETPPLDYNEQLTMILKAYPLPKDFLKLTSFAREK